MAACAYHGNWGRRAGACPAGCVMGGVFTDRNSFERLYQKIGKVRAFIDLFEDRTAAERRQIARALNWETESWDAEPGGPLLAVTRLEAEIQNLQLCRDVRVGPADAPPRIDVPFRPIVDDGTTRCLYHQRLRKQCGGCILNPIFPCNSNRDIFNAIYDKFAVRDVIPGFFNVAYDWPTLKLVARSLLWEAQMWFEDPVNGPRGVFLRLTRTLSTLKLPTLAPLVELADEDANGVNLRVSLEIGGLQQEEPVAVAAGLLGADEMPEPEEAISLAHLANEENAAWLKI